MSILEDNAWSDKLQSLIEATREDAPAVDGDATFPTRTVDALRASGLLGLISSKDHGGLGGGPRDAAFVVERLAQECGSASMVACMHYAGAAVVEAHGTDDMKKQVASGEHLLTLAFSESGSRSHFWAPVSSAKKSGDSFALDAHKSWVTSAHHATAYIWSSQPVAEEGMSTIWWVPRNQAGLEVSGGFDGLGLRGNDSCPVKSENMSLPESFMLGKDGAGLDVMLGTVLPLFNVMNAACSIGLMEAATTNACAHAAGTHYAHLKQPLAELPTIRAYLARMRIATDQARHLWLDAIAAMEAGREDTMLRVLEAKAAAGESATYVTDLGMRVCGGAAFRKDVGVERRFRDARAATVMAPTTDQLYDFIGKALCGMDVF